MPGRFKEESLRWFRQSQYDLRAVAWNMDGQFYSTACFLAQQSAEKALKSLLYYLGSRRRALMTHSLVEMVLTASKTVPSLQEVLVESRELDLHYVPSRYPNGLPGGYPHQFYGLEMATKAKSAAERILAVVTDYYKQKGADEFLLCHDAE